ncbi:hypothetical protein FDECE_3040 [Fusarium decemcellulare]|nr:hypothetical protein FDECE_3040 [Fusarium decemcellulare]
MAPSENSARRPNTKRRRITQACDYCHQRSIRCRASSDNQSCQNCKDFAQPCTYNRKPRRRGTKPRTTTSTTTIATPEPALEDPPPFESTASGIAQGDVSHGPRAQCHWEAPKMASQAVVMDLVEIYFEVVYPIFPFFHQPSFIRRISRAEYTTNRTLFAVTMALCALVSGRVRDGSVTSPQWDVEPLRALDPDVFYAQAKAQLLDLGHESDINCLRAHAILAITAIQNGKIRDLHWHLGIYHTLVAMDGLHDESNWPQSINIVEREERRRLFWSIYTLDIYSSVVWGGIIRCRENQSNVAYPIEVEDEVISDAALTGHNPATKETSPRNDSAIQGDCWLSGWNFITDLYRVLEHALTRPRPYRYRATRSAFLQDMFADDPTATDSSARERVLRMYLDLPTCFKETPPMVHCVRKDRFGFQAANITATVQLLRIVLMAASGASIQERCQIATEVVEAFVSIPVSYLLAISTPLLHHLGGIGTILGSVRGESLSEGGYAQVRAVMLSMAQLLESLEAIHRSASASQNLRSQVLQIDEYMARQRQGLPPQADVTTREGITEESSLQVQRNADYQQIVSDISTSWMLPASGDFLGDLAWDFDFG